MFSWEVVDGNSDDPCIDGIQVSYALGMVHPSWPLPCDPTWPNGPSKVRLKYALPWYGRSCKVKFLHFGAEWTVLSHRCECFQTKVNFSRAVLTSTFGCDKGCFAKIQSLKHAGILKIFQIVGLKHACLRKSWFSFPVQEAAIWSKLSHSWTAASKKSRRVHHYYFRGKFAHFLPENCWHLFEVQSTFGLPWMLLLWKTSDFSHLPGEGY